jgi:outer membrane protein assembly factor BamB
MISVMKIFNKRAGDWKASPQSVTSLVLFVLALLSAGPIVSKEPVNPAELPSLWTRTKGADWPQFLGPGRDSKSPETGIITDWSNGLKVVWQVALEESYGIGSVAQGRFYQCDRVADRVRVRCLNAETGKQIWAVGYPTDYVDLYGYNGGPRCSPLVDGPRVYTFGAEGMLYCLSANDGEEIWHVNTAEQFGVIQNFFGVGSNPVIEDDLLIVMIGGSPPASQRIPPGQLDQVVGNHSCIVAFDKLTGKVRYSISDELASYSSLQLATINNRRWCFAFARGGLLGFDPANGNIDFHYPWRARSLESVNASTPVVVNDEVLVSETYGPGALMLRVKPGSADVVWSDEARRRQRSLAAHWNTPIHVDGYVYGCSGRHTYEAELRCVEWKSGKVMWSQPDLTRTSLLHVDGHFICQGEDGQLRLVKANPQRYEEVASWTPRTDDVPQPGLPPRQLLRPFCWAAPILSHGLLYVRGEDRLVCLELIPN